MVYVTKANRLHLGVDKSAGYAILMDIDGNKIDFSTMPRGCKTPKLSNCKRITARSTVMTQVKVV